MSEAKKKSRECTICKYYGRRNTHLTSREMVYDETGSPIVINLCRHHAIELFKIGQQKFFMKYFQIANDVVGTDENQFLDLLIRTARKNLEKIY